MSPRVMLMILFVLIPSVCWLGEGPPTASPAPVPETTAPTPQGEKGTPEKVEVAPEGKPAAKPAAKPEAKQQEPPRRMTIPPVQVMPIQIEAPTDKTSEIAATSSYIRAMHLAAKASDMPVEVFMNTQAGKDIRDRLVFGYYIARYGAIAVGTVLLGLACLCFWFFHYRVFKTPNYTHRPFLFGLWNRQVVISYDLCPEMAKSDGWNTVACIAPALMVVAGVIILASGVY